MHLRRPILFSIFDFRFIYFVLYYYYRLILFEKRGGGTDDICYIACSGTEVINVKQETIYDKNEQF